MWSLFTYDWIPINGTPRCGIGLPDTHRYFLDLWVINGPRVLGCHSNYDEGLRSNPKLNICVDDHINSFDDIYDLLDFFVGSNPSKGLTWPELFL